MTTAAETLAPEAVLAAVREELKRMPSLLDLPASWTRRQIDEHETRRMTLDNNARRIQSELERLIEHDTQLRPLEEWREHLLAWRRTLADELSALPAPKSPREQGVIQNYTLSLRAIDDAFRPDTGYALQSLRLGALMAAAGFVADTPADGQMFGNLAWHGSLPNTDYRIADLTKRRAETQGHLNAAMKVVCQLLPEF